MIRNFRSKTAEHLFHGEHSRHVRKLPTALHAKVRRLFDQLNAATRIETLSIPPSNRLEKLSGDKALYWSIRVNKQWRVIFKWTNGDVEDVDIVDYH